MTLQELTGPHTLDAVDYYTFTERGDDCGAIRFRLDGISYAAVEDPEDGWRSSMKDLMVVDEPMLNVFPPTDVVCAYRSRSEYGECDLLDFVAVANGKVVLTVGTDNTDDWYPFYVGQWQPENLPHNEVTS